jgi:formylglycine-generating enzyme required for sulfatase activity
MMGSSDEDGESWEDQGRPQHSVRITRPFYLGIYPVTQGQFRKVTGENPSHFKESDGLPVEYVDWLSSISFCNSLSYREGLPRFYQIAFDYKRVDVSDWTGPGYRLPTEAEWEYACRAGTTTRYNFGDDAALLDEFGWYRQNSHGRTHPVCQKRPNDWGLYDMHGNVWEWCWDEYKPDYYRKSPKIDPTGPSGHWDHAIRGGSWGNDARSARSEFRLGYSRGEARDYIGFRVARPVPPP